MIPDPLYETMTEKKLAHYLDCLQLGGWQYHPVVGSTNDIALEWARADAPDWGLVVADQQLKGRGRNDRLWVTRPGVSLAFSLVLRPTPQERTVLPRFTSLAALGLIRALLGMNLKSLIKWPNDVLLYGKKVAGVLVETEWREDKLNALVVGMGVNVKPQAVPRQETLRYPAISVEEVLGEAIDRWELLASIIEGMIDLRPIITHPDFIHLWNTHLAFHGEVVPILLQDEVRRDMEVLGVMEDSRLELRDEREEKVSITVGEITKFFS
jgi:BirA family biotin operon repressor/biotin-[acetyl-CoA-carboxylase] ligase